MCSNPINASLHPSPRARCSSKWLQSVWSVPREPERDRCSASRCFNSAQLQTPSVKLLQTLPQQHRSQSKNIRDREIYGPGGPIQSGMFASVNFCRILLGCILAWLGVNSPSRNSERCHFNNEYKLNNFPWILLDFVNSPNHKNLA